MPNAATLSSEYVPTRQRPFAVTLTIVCIPLGGSLAGFIGGQILPRFGWRVLFLVVRHRCRCCWPRSCSRCCPSRRAILARHEGALARAARAAAPARPRRAGRRRRSSTRTEKAVGAARRSASCFVPEFRRDTLALFGSFFFCLLSVYMGTNWVPSMLVGNGFDVGTASYGLTAFNVGGVVGAILGAIVIMRLGSRISMLTMAAGAVAGAVVLAVMSIGPQNSVRRCSRCWLDRRPHQRRADDDVRAGRARVSDVDPRDRRRARRSPSAASAAC